MSKSEMDRLVEAIRDNKGLQEEVKKAATSNEALVEFAQNMGYNVDLKEVVAYIEAKKASLSLTDLDKVAGGGSVKIQTNIEVQAEAIVQVQGTQNQNPFTFPPPENNVVVVIGP